jgi:hypothetical protein
MTPDAFLSGVFDKIPDLVISSLANARRNLSKTRVSASDFIDILERQKLVQVAKRVEKYVSDLQAREASLARSTRRSSAVSHQKRSHQNATNTINLQRRCSEINDRVLFPPAHNGLVAGSSPAGPTSSLIQRFLLIFVRLFNGLS